MITNHAGWRGLCKHIGWQHERWALSVDKGHTAAEYPEGQRRVVKWGIGNGYRWVEYEYKDGWK